MGSPGQISEEGRMAIKELSRRGVSGSQIARQLDVTEGAVRYHRRRQSEGSVDGRVGRQTSLAAGHAERIERWVEDCRAAGEGLNLAALWEELVAEDGYEGSLRSLQRYVRKTFPRPAIRARRRVETPPGAQAQADWAYLTEVRIGGVLETLYAFLVTLSWSRATAVVLSLRKDLVAWQQVHLEAFRRLGGVAASVRVDNERTAMVRGCGSHGEVHPVYASFARQLRFVVDPCAVRSPQAKGKVERQVRTLRGRLREQEWLSLEEMQQAVDALQARLAERRICPATGTSVAEAHQSELQHLWALGEVPEPFDVVVHRKVSIDGLVHFEGRRYSVPFRFVGQQLEVRGCAGRVQVVHDGEVLIEHPRGSARRLLIDPSCYDGPSTPEVLAPQPLGRMGQRLQEIAAMPPEQRPIDLYADLYALRAGASA